MNKLILLTSVAVFSFGMISESRAECATGLIACGNDCAAEGATCHWEINSDGKLTITGSGAMKDNSYKTFTENEVPDNRITTASYAQYWDKITSIEVGDKITTTGTNAFQGLSRVTTAKISADVKDLPNFAFDRMPSLSSITFGEGSKLTNIGRATFQFASSLQSIDIPKGVTSIGRNAFANNQLTSVDIPEGVTSIGYGAFYGNKLENVSIPEGVTSIGDSAFSGNGYDDENGNFIPTLTSINLPDSLESIGENAFFGAAFTNLDIPDSVETIGNGAFLGSKLEKLILPDNINFSGSRAFNLADENAQILCRGDFENCKNNLQQKNLISKFWNLYRKEDGSLYVEYTNVGYFDFSNYGVAKDGDCNTANYYYDGRNCNYDPDADSRVCEHEISGYVKVGDYCVSPENSYAKKHYTPAEAAQWLHDGNDNFVVLTFKK